MPKTNKRMFYQVNHSDSQNAYLEEYILTKEPVTLVDTKGNYFHGVVISHDKLSLLLGSNNPDRPSIMFDKRNLSILGSQNCIERADKAHKNGPRKKRKSG